MAHEGCHEPVDRLSPETMGFHRAAVSLIEHAAMALEWNRRRNPVFDGVLREALFKDGPIAGQHGG